MYVALGFIVALGMCGCDEGEGFRCGESVSNGGSVRVCAAPQEVCICATQSCARPANTDEGCASGYVYVERPFARIEGCVEMRDTAWTSTIGTPPSLCLASGDAAVAIDARIDGDATASLATPVANERRADVIRPYQPSDSHENSSSRPFSRGEHR